MSHMTAGEPRPPGRDRSTDSQHVASWATLYRTAAAAAAVTAALIPIQIAVFIAYPTPRPWPAGTCSCKTNHLPAWSTSTSP
jgi:hypothetical protein